MGYTIASNMIEVSREELRMFGRAREKGGEGVLPVKHEMSIWKALFEN